MGRIVELLVALNAAGGIAVTIAFFRSKHRSERRRQERLERGERPPPGE